MSKSVVLYVFCKCKMIMRHVNINICISIYISAKILNITNNISIVVLTMWWSLNKKLLLELHEGKNNNISFWIITKKTKKTAMAKDRIIMHVEKGEIRLYLHWHHQCSWACRSALQWCAFFQRLCVLVPSSILQRLSYEAKAIGHNQFDQ